MRNVLLGHEDDCVERVCEAEKPPLEREVSHVSFQYVQGDVVFFAELLCLLIRVVGDFYAIGSVPVFVEELKRGIISACSTIENNFF